MELTPKVFRDVQFREKLRGGYHPEDVDEFLEQAAVGVEALLDQLHQVQERAQRAEQAAAEASATDEALKRMLVIAQRTADQAVREAREEAGQVVSEARSQADSVMADAEERGRRAYESGLTEGRANLQRAEESLRQAQQEAQALRSWVDLHKAHLLKVLREAQALVENAGLITPLPGPSAATNVADLRDRSEQSRDTSGPLGADVQGPGDNVPGNPYGPRHGGEERSEGNWDPRYIDDLQRGEAAGRVEEPVGPEQSTYDVASGQAGSDETGPGQAPPEEPGDQRTEFFGQQGTGETNMRPNAGDDTLAFDERALDSFFSDQDLGDERGLGRFRRRQ
ncbi:MAG: DivIVA domain-containing protein [Acidimicrobiales bacterium]